MNFKTWLENDRSDLEAAVLSSIEAYGGEEENSFWLGKRVRDEFESSAQVRNKLLAPMEVRQLLNGRNAVEFIKAKDPTFGDFVNWLLQGVS